MRSAFAPVRSGLLVGALGLLGVLNVRRGDAGVLPAPQVRLVPPSRPVFPLLADRGEYQRAAATPNHAAARLTRRRAKNPTKRRRHLQEDSRKRNQASWRNE